MMIKKPSIGTALLLVRAETARYAKIVKEAGIKAE